MAKRGTKLVRIAAATWAMTSREAAGFKAGGAGAGEEVVGREGG